jgi:hypothetical protein
MVERYGIEWAFRISGIVTASAVLPVSHLWDVLGSLNTLTAFMLINSLSMIALWPALTSLTPLAIFAVFSGLKGGQLFTSMPTIVGNVFGFVRVPSAMSIMLTGWIGEYLFVSVLDLVPGQECCIQS